MNLYLFTNDAGKELRHEKTIPGKKDAFLEKNPKTYTGTDKSAQNFKIVFPKKQTQ